jgi:riboflavin kinase / FMN adenylyltransferase
MLTYRDIRQAHLPGPTALTIGNFDGIHLGHQALHQYLKRVAEELSIELAPGQDQTAPATVETCMLTFDPHPAAFFRSAAADPLLTTPRERLTQAAALGINYGIIHPFTAETAQLEARQFVEMLKTHLHLVALVVGPDFALGRNRTGTIERLRELGDEYDFSVAVMEPYYLDGKPVRSSRIRDFLLSGDVTNAERMLGRPYRVSGFVQAGDQRGRTVGIPTANVGAAADKLLPADGVYATRTHVATFECAYVFDSVTNAGVRPTVDGLHRRVESHLLDFPALTQIDDLYGETVAVDFLVRLRGEQRFASVSELVQQIHTDITRARHWFAEGTF